MPTNPAGVRHLQRLPVHVEPVARRLLGGTESARQYDDVPVFLVAGASGKASAEIQHRHETAMSFSAIAQACKSLPLYARPASQAPE